MSAVSVMGTMSMNSKRMEIKAAFLSLIDDDEWNIYSIKAKSPMGELVCSARPIVITPRESYSAYLKDVADSYLCGKKPVIDVDFRVRKYDGGALDVKEAFCCKTSDPAIEKSFRIFTSALSNPDVERDAEEIRPNAIAFERFRSGEHIIFISVHSPLARLKHRWMLSGKSYRMIDKPVLTLSTKIDAIIYNSDAFFLTISGAQLFVTESICKAIANDKVDELAKVKYISGVNVLREISQKGMNPRRFIGYNPERVRRLDDLTFRGKIAAQFGINRDGFGNLDLSDAKDAERFIKVVCNRGMVDPFTDDPVEVRGATKWEIK